MAIMAHGKIGLYNGRLQLYIDFLRPAGEGLLLAQFERLKAQLHAEGLTERKRPLPAHPRRIGLVTSPTGAALRDMLNVLGRRYPLAEVLLAPALVQGEGAADSIVEALYSLYDLDLDVIILARGGGSIEDLWCFNEEVVARAVFASPVPLVTGVGHETDTTIADYVSDLRAPTPSAAAELVTPDMAGLQADLAQQFAALNAFILTRVHNARADVAYDLQRLERAAPLARLATSREQVGRLGDRLGRAMARQAEIRRQQVQSASRSLLALSPERTLARGYAVVLRAADGVAVTSPDDVAPHERVRIVVRGGEWSALAE
ncbi:MAG TPA: exodeoxyribonuclease VII large subunit, partial [Herpetosiphonaceae bacterium]|nr:exodeoxyribonuclease VII large subunit [Herpetosiphonaceae bacterium]